MVLSAVTIATIVSIAYLMPKKKKLNADDEEGVNKKKEYKQKTKEEMKKELEDMRKEY